MLIIDNKILGNVVRDLVKYQAKKATQYITDKLVVKASRVTHKGKFAKDKIEIVLTAGRPNYEEREFIKICKKAKEPFPVKKTLLKFPKKII